MMSHMTANKSHMTLCGTGQVRHHRSGDTPVGLWSATLALHFEQGSSAAEIAHKFQQRAVSCHLLIADCFEV